jgi:O-antigen ligase
VSRWPLARLERWFLRGGLFLLPLAHWWSTYDQYVLPKLLLARVLLIGLVALFVARTLFTGTMTIRRSPLDLPLLAFLASGVLSSVFAVNLNVALFGIYSRYDGLLTLLTYTGLFWFSVQALNSPAEARALLRVLLASAYVVAALAIVQWVGDSLVQAGAARAYGTLGQWNVLGGFLAMLWPVAYMELAEARSWNGRILAANVLVLLGVALVLTFSRSAWIGSAVAAAVLVGTAGSRRLRLSSAAVALGAVAALAIAWLAGSAGFQLGQSVAARATTVFSPSDWAPRPDIWRDTLPLIASRPIAGYGPDTFGLVFPRFNTIYYALPVDKAHAELLQIAATQGLIGLGLYLLIVVAFVRAFWSRRHLPEAGAIFAGWAAYQVALQLNFTALSSAFPFWIFCAAAMVCWGATTTTSHELGHRRLAGVLGGVAGAGLLTLTAFGVVLPYLADASLFTAFGADISRHPLQARAAAERARSLGPEESVYAVEVGNVAFEEGDWAGARDAYMDAARLGTYNAAVFRNLAIADRNLGLLGEARAAALGAYFLSPLDPANRALLAQFGGPGP